MDHISHHLNPGSLKTNHAADYSALGTQHESGQHTAKGAALASPRSTKSGVAAIEIPKRQKNSRTHTGMVKQGDKTL